MQSYHSLHSINWLSDLKLLVGIFVVALLSGFIFSTSIPTIIAETTPSISDAKDIAVAEDGGGVFVLNGDGTISIYDLQTDTFVLARASLLGTEGLEIVSLDASRSGKYVAALAVNATTIRVVIYEVESSSISAKLRNINSYDLSRGGRGNSVLSKFSYDEGSLYVADGPAGNLFVLSTGTANTKNVDIGGIITGIDNGSSSEQLFLLTQNPDQLVAMSKSDYSIIHRYDLKSAPTDLLYNSTLKRVFVSRKGNDVVTVVDLKTGKALELSVGKLPASLTYDRASGNVFVANNGDGSLNIIVPDYTVKTMRLGLSAYPAYPITLWYSNQAKILLALHPLARKLYFIDPIQLQIIREEVVNGWAQSLLGGNNESRAVIFKRNSSDFLFVDAKKQEVTSYPPESKKESNLYFSSPLGVVVHKSSGRIFVANISSGNITVIDSNNYQMIAEIPTGPSPYGLTLDQIASKLYVTDPVQNIVTVVDISKNDYPQTGIPVGRMPRSMSGNNVTKKIYVSLSGENRVAVINGATDLLETTIDLGSRNGFPLLIAVNENKNEIYVVDYGADFVSVIDGATNKIVKKIKVGNKPIWVSYYPELDKIFVTVEGDKKVVVIDPATHEIIKEFKLDAVPYRPFLDRVTNLVYVIHRAEKKVTIFKDNEGKIELLSEREIPFLGQLDTTYNMIYANDGQLAQKNTDLVYITSQKLNNLSVLELVRDTEGIIDFNLFATINSNGDVSYSETDSRGVELYRLLGRIAPLFIFILALITAVIIYRKYLATTHKNTIT